MPAKLRNITFIVICICALSIAFIYQGAKKMNVLPASFNNGTYSYLEGAKLQTRPAVSLENIKKGTFQTQTEKWLTAKVPKRDSVMLFNAKVQRGVIKAANLACGFETVPTYFGSEYAYTEKFDLLEEVIDKQTDKLAESYQTLASTINKFAEKYPNINVSFSMPDRVSHSESNPTNSLVSNSTNHIFKSENLIKRLNSSVKVVDLSTSSTQDFLEKYYRTDHHWNIVGAYEAYEKIMLTCYPELPTYKHGNLITYEKPNMYASASRKGLMLPKIADKLTDFDTDFSDLKVSIQGKEAENEDVRHVQKYKSGQFNQERFTERYGEYFYYSKTTKLQYTSKNHRGRNMLIIGDSYTNSIDSFFAEVFDVTIKIDQRYNKESVSSLIRANNITDVLIFGCEEYLFEDYFISTLNN